MTDLNHHVRELHHRVKNNLQIIVSLMNLKSRMLPPERQEDIRFLREHVQAIAVVYRLAYGMDDMTTVPIGQLIEELISDFRQIRSIAVSQIEMTDAGIVETLNLDQAIALGLYLASVVPPYLESAARAGRRVTISAGVKDRILTLSLKGGDEPNALMDPLAGRLRDSYAKQLKLVSAVPTADAWLRLSLPLD